MTTSKDETTKPMTNLFLTSLLSGGIAGTTVDVCLFPLDTIKTRLQSSVGFTKAGGFHGVYRGLSITALGSSPGAALFFATYEHVKHLSFLQQYTPAVGHMIAASTGEIMACLVRVPTEVIKQRMQTGAYTSISETFAHMNSWKTLYSGFGITIMREIPFSLIQFPLYEQLKKSYSNDVVKREISSVEAAVCGSLAGAVAAAVTTPLDVLKTRVMLGADAHGVPYRGVIDTAKRLIIEGTNNNNSNSSSAIKSKGRVGIFFSGVGPRVGWISVGGFFFFGAYEQAKTILSNFL